MDEIDSVAMNTFAAIDEGRHDDALRILKESLDQLASTVPRSVVFHFSTMFGWSQLAEV